MNTKEGAGLGLDALLRSALEQSPTATVLVDDHDHVLFFNAAAERLWGHVRSGVLGRALDILLPGGLPSVDGCGRTVQVEHGDGHRSGARFEVSWIEAQDGAYRLLQARDAACEIAQREEHRLLLAAVNHTDRPMLVLDAQRRIVHLNRAFIRMCGYSTEEALGQVPTTFLSASRMSPEEFGRLQEQPWGRAPVQVDVPIGCKDGREIWCRVSSTPIREEDGDGLDGYSVDVLTDMTEDMAVRRLQRDVLAALTSGLAFQEFGDYLASRVAEVAADLTPSILLVDAERRLRPWAVSRLPEAYNRNVDGVRIGEGAGSCGTAAWRGEPVLSVDIARDPLWARFRELTLPHGLRACWSYPIKRRDGSVAGTFAFYASEPRAPQAFHERFIDVCVHLCALAIEREENRLRLARMVQFDTMTGLPSRAHLHRYIDERLASDHDRRIAFFVLDIDRFKDINDALGHAAGDQVLAALANRLQSRLQAGSFLSRTEGDQFVMVTTDCDVRCASQAAERLLEAFEQPVDAAGQRFHVSASIGISHYPQGGQTRDDLLASAKGAMYQVKTAGGSGYQFFSPEMNLIARDRLLLGAALRRAVAEGGLHLHYQPQVWTDSGELYGVEALARWHDASLGDIPPSRFIELAEEIGEIEAVGRWALREACRQMASWRLEGLRVPVVSVNLSPSSFRHPNLPQYVGGLLHEFDLPGQSLTIEITESAAMTLTPDMQETLLGVRALGIGLSVDDFGTGYSSLSNLAKLPVTEVKIDRSFIERCRQERRLQSLVAAVIGLGRSLDLTVVAEGVETQAQFALLKTYRCPLVQGYLFARPLAPQALAGWIENARRARKG